MDNDVGLTVGTGGGMNGGKQRGKTGDNFNGISNKISKGEE